jgi:lysophospholipase L1-like esterase
LVPKAPKIFVLGIPPMARWWEAARERNASIREINAMLAEGAAENGYRFVELESVLADESGFLRGEMTSDGVHLSAMGYVAVLEKMKSAGLMKTVDRQHL